MVGFLLWLTSGVFAGTLDGVLREQGTGDPIQGATVTVGVHEVETNARGQFRFEDLVTEKMWSCGHPPISICLWKCRSQCP